MECIFCKIANQEIDTQIVYEDEEVIAFNDINPQSPVHILIVPKDHIATINDLGTEHTELIGKLVLTAQQLATEHDIDERGYRLVFNCNRNGGQEVYHIHLHLLGGRSMHWPPG